MTPLERRAWQRGRRAAATELARKDGDRDYLPCRLLMASWLSGLPRNDRMSKSFVHGWQAVLVNPDSAPKV
jgi:hypothetical protein